MINVYLNEWINFLKKNLNYSPHTYSSYRRDIKDFLNFCSKNDLNGNKPDKETIRNFLYELNNRALKKSSIARKISSIKSFYK